MQNPAPQLIGLLGGSFDPIHNAHLNLAQAAFDQLKLDQLRLIPVGNAWQKSDHPMTPAPQRLAMVKLAIDSLTCRHQVVIDTQEIQRTTADGSPTYTVDTLTALRHEFPKASLVWIIGSDAFVKLSSWTNWQRLFALTHFAVVTRGADRDWKARMPPALADEFNRRHVRRVYVNEYPNELQNITHGFAPLSDVTHGRITLLYMEPQEISSTEVRHRIKNHQINTIKGLVPESVLEYITNHQLYL